MNINIILLKLLLNKNLFNKYNNIINLEYFKNNNRELFKLFLTLFKLQEKEEEPTVTALSLLFYTLYPLTKDDERHVIDNILEKMESLEVDEQLALEYLEKHHEQTLSTQIALKALEVSQGKAEMATLTALIGQATRPLEASTDDLFVSTDLEVLVNNVMESQGLRWRLTTMNRMLGSLRKGKFGFIFARPETGKTTFLASEVTYMAEQAHSQELGPVLWLNNEEEGGQVMLRCYQAVFGVTTQELYTNLQYYKDQYTTIIGDKLMLYDDANISKKKVDELCEKYKPSLIIFDQIDKVHWTDSERYDLKMKAIYQWGRELSKKYGAVIGVCQAGGTAEGKKYLNMNDVDSSHTAKQGEADFMIGIGKTNNDGEEFLRYISLCKNKLAGDVDTVADLRHGKMPVLIQPEIARYTDSIEWT